MGFYIIQDMYDRLDCVTALNYHTRNELKRELGQMLSDDIKSLCSFIRSEATTLEITGNNLGNCSNKPEKKVNAVQNAYDTNNNKCQFGCEVKHRLVDCEEYMKTLVV